MALYIQFLVDGTKSRSAIKEPCNSIPWVHSMTGQASPTVSPFVKAMLESLQRVLENPTMEKVPVTSVMLEEMVRDTGKSHSLSDLG